MAVTPVTPQGFRLTDPGTGGRLIAEISNCADYTECDVLLIYNENDKIIARGDPTIGVVNVTGLTNDVPITLFARVLSKDQLSDPSNEDIETPTDTNADIKADCDVFTRVFVNFRVEGGTTIEWRLAKGIGAVPPFTFFVQFSHQSTLVSDTWEDVATVIDSCLAVDPDRRLFKGINQRAYYRVILRDAAGNEFFSEAQQAVGAANRHDFLIAREIVRKEILRFRFVGTKGFLLKVKVFGTPCPQCLDQDTGDVTDSNCPVCFGTAILGGYHAPAEFPVELGFETRDIVTDVNYGGTQNISIQCRCLGAPELTDGDLWIREDTDERYFVNEIKEAARLVVPIVVLANFRKIPYDDPAYTVARP